MACLGSSPSCYEENDADTKSSQDHDPDKPVHFMLESW